MAKEKKENLIQRPPIVVVMGHIDHGKTKLLDFIRKTKIAEKEAGGITQSIGAYEIIHSEKKITFIDTPGHEAFSKMRGRGARVADLAILVVAADEGVKAQTLEALEHIKSAGIPFVVAINKIDKPEADVTRVKNELSQNGIYLEGMGGNISYQEISAKTGQGVKELLDLILLAADLEELKADPNALCQGVIIESKIDPRRGISAVLIIENGTLRIGDEIATSSARGKVKMMEDFLGQPVKQVSFSSPVLVVGFENLPQIGEQFSAGKMISVSQSENILSPNKVGPTEALSLKKTIIKLILKADVSGSLEALIEIVKSLENEDIGIEIILAEVGDILENDVKLALSSSALILGFKVKIRKGAESLVRIHEIKIINSEIIYELFQNLKQIIKEIPKEGEVKGILEILAIFGKKNSKQIVGGKMLEGKFNKGAKLEIWRQSLKIGEGKIINLQVKKLDAIEVQAGEECGILLDPDVTIKVGDQLKAVL